jgi:choline dehydrogenase-like flavoprotein
VKRIHLQNGKARSIVFHADQRAKESELDADIIVIAAGAIESARLLLLSRDSRNPNGIGNASGMVGKNLMFHHIYSGRFQLKEKIFPGRMGPNTGECHQFLDPPERGKHGGIKIAMWGDFSGSISKGKLWESGAEIVDRLRPMLNSHSLTMSAETVPSPEKRVVLSKRKDRFGDEYADVHYQSNEFDHASYVFARDLFGKFTASVGAKESSFARPRYYSSGHHHLGTCRMGNSVQDSVVDSFGRVHGLSNLFVLGGSNFVGSSAVNPTLTMMAFTFRTVQYILDQLL